jgi:hypothetical protein
MVGYNYVSPRLSEKEQQDNWIYLTMPRGSAKNFSIGLIGPSGSAIPPQTPYNLSVQSFVGGVDAALTPKTFGVTGDVLFLNLQVSASANVSGPSYDLKETITMTTLSQSPYSVPQNYYFFVNITA